MGLHLDGYSHEAAKHAVLRWPYSRLAIDELSDFEIHVGENTNERYRAFLVGKQERTRHCSRPCRASRSAAMARCYPSLVAAAGYSILGGQVYR